MAAVANDRGVAKPPVTPIGRVCDLQRVQKKKWQRRGRRFNRLHSKIVVLPQQSSHSNAEPGADGAQQ